MMTEIIDQYDDAAVRKVVIDVLTLAADSITAGSKLAEKTTTDAGPEYYHGIDVATTAINNIAAAFAARTDKPIPDLIDSARAKLTELAGRTPEEAAKAVGDRLMAMLHDAMRRAGIDPNEVEFIDAGEAPAVDKVVPDGENPQSVIERVFKRKLAVPPYPISALFFGRSGQGNAFGLYESEDHTKFPVLVACAGDAHMTPLTAVFDSRDQAENYIKADFDPSFLPPDDELYKAEKHTLN